VTTLYEYGGPAAFALFVWWFSTGLILYLDGLPRHTFRWSMLGATALLGLGVYGLAVTRSGTEVISAYLAFASSLAIWGWLEISFYLGYVTGPRKQRCPEGCRGWRHFGHAVMASLWHEIAILAAAGLLFAMLWGQPNTVGLWTFVVLWWMHQSAKLNVLLGVRNLNAEFLPEHLDFLKSFLNQRPMNLLFPVSITVSTVIGALLIMWAADAATAFDRVGYTFMATMMVLAILEHWFLVLPLPAGRLWAWYLKARGPSRSFDVDVVAGFLGAGKTTFLQRTLAEADPETRTVALINDFSEVGVDASLLAGRGADVVELPNGCICCSLKSDLSAQLEEVIARYQPGRILIEPSGVADIASLTGVLAAPQVAPFVKHQRLYTVIDAGAFLRDYAAMPGFFDTQARLSPTFIVNKIDLASNGELATIRDTLHALNPHAAIRTATHGVMDAEIPAPTHGHGRPADPTPVTAAEANAGPAVTSGADGHGHRHADQDPAGVLSTWSAQLHGECDPQSLRDVLDAVAHGAFGEVARVKGVARAGAGWVHFDMAGGRASVAAFAPKSNDEPRVVAIGRKVDGDRLQAAFDACATPVVGTC
jgi:putative photosynthetic complex assembly protein 2